MSLACSDGSKNDTDDDSRSGSGGFHSLLGTGGEGSAAGGSGSGGAGPAVICTAEMEALVPLENTPGSCPAAGDGISIESAEFCLTLDPDSQTVRSLRPKADLSFDFAPSDRLAARSGNGYVHLGDLNLRLRETGQTSWQNVSTSVARAAVTALPSDEEVQASADLSPTLPELPVQITRSWSLVDGRLALRFVLQNHSASAVEIGGLGIPLVFNNIISGRSLEEAHERCSFSDPYLGRDAGYLQVTRLKGTGPALLVLPEEKTPFEAYGELLNLPGEDSEDPVPLFYDRTPRNQTFEGFHQWIVHSRAYAENEWSNVEPYNPASSHTLAPGESRTYGLRFVLSPSIRQIEDTLVRENRPHAVGVPGYILPQDVEARLFFRYPHAVTAFRVEPAGALDIFETNSTENCYRALTLRGNTWGRVRLTIEYADDSAQTVHFNVIKPAEQVVTDMGQFLTTEAWFVDATDPFGRSPSVMTYDREDDSIVTQSKQSWVCGLGDDGGATWLAGIMKLWGKPDAEQIEKYEEFVDEVVWGGLQYNEGPLMYGVKRTLFYYEPNELPPGYYDSDIDFSTWMAWPRAHTEQVPRSYNYPHVTALYFTLYQLARNTEGLVSHHPWDWYLTQAYETAVAMTTVGNQYAEFGVMDGSIFLETLNALKAEQWTSEATDLEARMENRADHWATLAFPFGSEMAWDSTGQEEVYVWSKYFGNDDKAQITLNAILGYMPTIPHWGYNGSARRYWDFIYGGAKIDRLERMLHHYGSSLNSIPVLSEYRDHPDDFHLLRIGFGGMMGPLSNIDEQGFPSMAFHAFADTLKWDARTGDYGLAFFGHAQGAGSYLVEHPEFGWLSFGGNLSRDGDTVVMTPLDSFRKRIYLAPVGLWLTLDSGQFESVTFSPSSKAVKIILAPSSVFVTTARLRIEKKSGLGSYAPTASLPVERGAFVVPLEADGASLELTPN